MENSMRLFGSLALLLSLAACGPYTPGLHHGGADDASTGSHLGGVDSGSEDAGSAGTFNNQHFGLGSTPAGGGGH